MTPTDTDTDHATAMPSPAEALRQATTAAAKRNGRAVAEVMGGMYDLLAAGALDAAAESISGCVREWATVVQPTDDYGRPVGKVLTDPKEMVEFLVGWRAMSGTTRILDPAMMSTPSAARAEEQLAAEWQRFKSALPAGLRACCERMEGQIAMSEHRLRIEMVEAMLGITLPGPRPS